MWGEWKCEKGGEREKGKKWGLKGVFGLSRSLEGMVQRAGCVAAKL